MCPDSLPDNSKDWDKVFSTSMDSPELVLSQKAGDAIGILDQMIDQYWTMFNAPEIRPLEKVRVGRILKETIDVRLKYSMEDKGDKEEKRRRDYDEVRQMLRDSGVSI